MPTSTSTSQEEIGLSNALADDCSSGSSETIFRLRTLSHSSNGSSSTASTAWTVRRSPLAARYSSRKSFSTMTPLMADVVASFEARGSCQTSASVGESIISRRWSL